jgi:CheY-like chemotaxis protein
MRDDRDGEPGSGAAEGDWWQAEPATSERIATLRAAAEVLEGVLRAARSLDTTCRARAVGHVETPQRCVLVVDDCPDTRELYAEALRCAGFRAEMAGDGKIALEMAFALRPDAVVLDFSMPEMDGGQVMRRLATDNLTCHIPVVMVSAFADEVPREVRLSCRAFLPKPCELQELCRLVNLVIACPGTLLEVSASSSCGGAAPRRPEELAETAPRLLRGRT